MRYSQISVLITALFLCLLSCRETIGEQHNSLPKESNGRPSQQEKIEIPSPIDSTLKSRKPLEERKTKKKKKKASDTLRPKVAVL